MRYKWYLLVFLSVAVGLGIIYRQFFSHTFVDYLSTPVALNKTEPSSNPSLAPYEAPARYIIPMESHVFQTFNNCGPASLSMALSYFGIYKSQSELGDIMRPYQIANGDNDDKSVTLQEVAEQAEKYGLHAYLRPNGTPEKLEEFIALGLPIVTRTWLAPNEDIGHYRLVRGYDRNTQEFIQDDSLQGKNLKYSYAEFGEIWRPFNYEYLVLVDDGRKDEVEEILGEEKDIHVAWENALERVNKEIEKDADNKHLIFAKSRIYYYLGDYEKSVAEFEKVEDSLSFRTLWYQIEPIKAYFELGRRDRVFEISSTILENENRAFSELYMMRGKIYESEGKIQEALDEYQKALQYNKNMKEAKETVSRLMEK